MIIEVNDKMQAGYTYETTARCGKDFDPKFKPELSPKQMLEMGVFEGKYLNDCKGEFPESWFKNARLSPFANEKINMFSVKSRQSLAHWRAKNWIIAPDPRGWFQWYCRYYLGRRIPEVDAIQIKRWRAFARHKAQVKKNCLPHDYKCRHKQRQALLQWAYNPLI